MESRIYVFDIRKRLNSILKIALISLFFSLVFYDSLMGMIFFMPFVPFLLKYEKENFFHQIKKKIKEEFKDFLLLLSGNLGAGYSLEKSFCQSYEEYQKNYKEEYLTKGLRDIVIGLGYNQRLEDMLLRFGNRTRVKEIEEFAELLVTAKIYGGNIIKLIKSTSDNYRENYVTELEIQTMIASKKLEARIMLMAPILIVLFMRVTNGTYMDVLYNTDFGTLVMTVCMYLLVATFFITNKIMEIGV